MNTRPQVLIVAAVLCGCLSSLASAVTAAEAAAPAVQRAAPQAGSVEHAEADLLIVGGTESGWAAAIQAARMNIHRIIIVHDGQWLGGQYTEQALACVDENKGVGKVGWGVDWHPMKRSFHRSGLFRELMDGIEAFNTDKYGSPMPGRPHHGPSTFRPAEAEAVFRRMLQPYIDSGQVRFVTDRYPVRADVTADPDRPRLTGLWFAGLKSETPDLHVRAKLTIDASDWGDAIQVAGAAFECGPDPQSRYNEPSAPSDLSDVPPNEMNPITWAMIVEESDGETPIAQPDRYDDRNFVRTSKLSLQAMKGLEWDRPVRLGSIPHWPDAGQASHRQLSIYTVRRIVDGFTSKTGKTSILLNYMLGQDYPLERLPQHVVDALEATEPGSSTKNIVLLNRDQRQIIFDDAKRHSLSLLYHLQNFVHQQAADKTNSFRRFHLSDEFGTADRLPFKPYIRESLRLKAMYMMREQDGRNRDGFTKDLARERFSHVLYPDGLFCWQFHYDFHRTGRAWLKDEGSSGPWIDFEKPGRNTRYVSDRSVFPARSLIPEQMDGLLGAQKNVGYSSIVCAAIRLHDQCVAIGQASGAVAAVSLTNDCQPREIPYDRQRLEQVRAGLCGGTPAAGEATQAGVPLQLWPYRDLPTEHAAFVAINRLGALRALPLDVREVDFHPDAPATTAWRSSVLTLTKQQLPAEVQIPDQDQLLSHSGVTRGQFCQLLWAVVGDLPLQPFQRLQPDDADGDGIADINDPSLFTGEPEVAWSTDPPSAEQDGLPNEPVSELTSTTPPFGGHSSSSAVVAFNFTGQKSATVSGFINDVGLAFDETRGFGWDQDIRSNNRRRGALAEAIRDTFLFTRTANQWECLVENGKWQVTVCAGDSGHDQTGHVVRIEDTSLIDHEPTAAGTFVEATAEVDVTDGRLTVQLGPQPSGSNTCINWIRLKKL
jgi:hypothetical protein